MLFATSIAELPLGSSLTAPSGNVTLIIFLVKINKGAKLIEIIRIAVLTVQKFRGVINSKFYKKKDAGTSPAIFFSMS
jgi:hypothetical protein